MKLKVFYVFSLLLLTIFYSCSKNDSNPTAEQPVGNVTSFYPGTSGSRFSYSSSINNVPAGSRVVTIGGTTTIRGSQYTIQKNFVQFGTDTSTVTTYFRMTTDTLFFYVDTTGLSSFIPPAYKSSIVLSASKEAKVLASPLSSSSSWNAYSLALSLGPFSLNVIQLNASYVGNENLTLNLTSGQQTKSAQKIHYQLILSIPDSTLNLTNIKKKTFDAFGWFVDSVGLARLEGNAAVIEAITRNSISLTDTTKTAVETITSYSIK